MRRMRLLVRLVAVVVVVGGWSAGVAHAGPVWIVKGSKLGSGETALANAKFGKLTIKWEDSGTKTKFEAECQKATGEVELKGGNPGKDAVKSLKIKECVLLKGGTGCELAAGASTEELPGWATELEEKSEKVYDTISGTSFSVLLEGCEKASFSKSWLFRGSVKVELKNETGKLKGVLPVGGVTGDTLKSEGAEATISGEGSMEEKLGGTLETKTEPLGPYVYLAGGTSPLMGTLNLSTEQVGDSHLKGLLAGVKTEIVCHEAHGESTTVENVLTEGIEHVLGLTSVHFLKCLVLEPAGEGCKIHNELVHVHSHILGATIGGAPRVQFEPEAGNNFAEVTLEGCSNTNLNNTFPVTGVADAIPNNATSEIEFTPSSGSALKFGGKPATFEAKFKIEMEGGGALEFK